MGGRLTGDGSAFRSSGLAVPAATYASKLHGDGLIRGALALATGAAASDSATASLVSSLAALYEGEALDLWLCILR